MSQPPIDWSVLLTDAVAKPGVISEAYRRFWNYSTGNQLLAWFQCIVRNIEPGPIHTFRGWKECGRHVKKGEKALTLCMPVTIRKRKVSEPLDEKSDEQAFTRFVHRPHWFVLSQTEGADYQPADLPDWNEERALAALEIERVSFAHTNGNAQGYATARRIAVSPIAFTPHRTLFHELAHVVLEHTAEVERMDDDDQTPCDLREVEAESVALICCESLGLSGAEYSRGYIQHWLAGGSITQRSAQKIFKAADTILKAGRLDPNQS